MAIKNVVSHQSTR